METSARVGDPQGVLREGISGHVCSWHCNLSVHEVFMAKVRLSATVTDMFLSPRGKESLYEQHISALLEEPLGKINIFYCKFREWHSIDRNTVNRRRLLY